jgi:transposase
MLIVETIRKVRLSIHRDGKSIRQTAKDLHLSKNTVKKVIRSDQTSFEYKRMVQPRPKLGPYVRWIEGQLERDQKLGKRQRRTAQILYEQLQDKGFEGGYDSVRRFVQRWRKQQRQAVKQVFVPLIFDPGEAFQFDWSHEWVHMAGMPVKAKVAHLRLCSSRMFLAVAYPRETQEMVFDAHIRAFEFFGGVCHRGIYDNLKTVVNKILTGKERQFNNRFAQLCSHYLFEPVACTPAAGWEKGQVENQVGVLRKRFFTPRVNVTDFEHLNALLKQHCISWAKTQRPPEDRTRTIWQAFEEEKMHLIKLPPAFDGYAERPARVSPSSLVSFDRNRYSVDCRHVGKTVQLRAYANRIVIVKDTVVVGDHPRQFGRDKTMFDPWHYLPVLKQKPGVLRNGAPFKDWDLPESIVRVGQMLKQRYSDWDRQFVGILTALPLYGLDAVAQACTLAIKSKSISKEVILNYLNRSGDQDQIESIKIPDHLVLKHEPVADCRRYEQFIRQVNHVAR